jgi:hypothetical protein
MPQLLHFSLNVPHSEFLFWINFHILTKSTAYHMCWNVWNWNCSCEHCWDNEFDKINRSCILNSFKWLQQKKVSWNRHFLYQKNYFRLQTRHRKKSFFWYSQKCLCVKIFLGYFYLITIFLKFSFSSITGLVTNY